jgi:hypothetical protein
MAKIFVLSQQVNLCDRYQKGGANNKSPPPNIFFSVVHQEFHIPNFQSFPCYMSHLETLTNRFAQYVFVYENSERNMSYHLSIFVTYSF